MNNYKSSRREVYSAIDGERDYQDSLRIVGVFTETFLPIPGELICIREYINKSLSAYTSSPGEVPAEVLQNIRKVAALCVRTLEHYGATPRQ